MIHAPTVRNSIANFVLGQLNGGRVVFLSAGGDIVSILHFGNPAFGDGGFRWEGRADANAIESDPSATGGRIVRAELQSAQGVPKVLATVGLVDARSDEELARLGVVRSDIELTDVTIKPGQTVSLSNLFYVAAP